MFVITVNVVYIIQNYPLVRAYLYIPLQRMHVAAGPVPGPAVYQLAVFDRLTD